jgi:hypothetical protein
MEGQMAGWPSSSVPESILWLVRSIGSRGSLDGDEVARYAPRRFRERGQRLSASLLVWRAAFGTFTPVDCAIDQCRFVIRGRDARDRSCTLSVTVENTPPFRFERYLLVRDPPPGYSYREAQLSDYPACAAVEAQSQTISDEGTYTLARGPSFQTYIELQGQSRICVIEHDGEIVGWNAASLRRVSTPEPFTFGYLAQAYILADHQSSGAYWPASAQNMAWLQEVADQNYWYLNVGNERSKHFTQGAEFWSVPVCDVSIACRSQDTPGIGRPAEASDAARLANLFNAAHDQEEFFDPYTEATLSERLVRAPRFYGYPHILLGGKAALGVWMSGERIVHTVGGVTTHSRLASVLDFGFEGDSGLTELLDLLRTASGLGYDAGMTHLSILSSEPSAPYPLLAEMADGIDHYTMATLRIEPPELVARGLYADHIYF